MGNVSDKRLKLLYDELNDLEQEAEPILKRMESILKQIDEIEQDPDKWEQDLFADYAYDQYKNTNSREE